MATKRFGYLDDFVLKNTNVGIGSSAPTTKLEVIGGTRSQNVKVTGVSTDIKNNDLSSSHVNFVVMINEHLYNAKNNGI